MNYNQRTMSSRETRVKSAEAARSKTVITQDDVKLKDQENPFSFKQFVKRKNRSAPVERERDNRTPIERVKDNKTGMEREKNYKGARTYTMAPKVSLPSKKSERTVQFKEPSYSSASIYNFKNVEDRNDYRSDDNSDDDWSESYLPSFIEQALNESKGPIPIARSDLDTFSITSADLTDVPAWQLKHEKDSSITVQDAFQSTDDSSSSLTDVSHQTADSGSPLPDVPLGTCHYNPLSPDVSFESTDQSSQLEDISSGKFDYCLPLSEGCGKKTEPDFVAHGDVLGDSNIQSLQRNCDELTEKNSGLQKKMELMKKINEEQADRIKMLERKLADKRLEEEKEAKALETVTEQVEVNLKAMTMRAVRSEKNVAKLKDTITALMAELELLKTENSKLRHMESVGLHTAKQNAQLALESIHKVIFDARSSVQHLVTGGETLRFVTGILKAIDRISEMPLEKQ